MCIETAGCIASDAGGCSAETDENYGILWPSTKPNTVITTNCPDGVGKEK